MGYPTGMKEQTEEKEAEVSQEKRQAGDPVEFFTDKELSAMVVELETRRGVDHGDLDDYRKNSEEETPPASSEDVEDESDPVEESKPDKELDAAMNALRRTQGLSSDTIDSMSRDDILALAAPLKESRSQMDELQRQFAEFRKSVESGQIGEEDSEDLGAPDSEEHPSQSASTLNEGREAFEEEFGSDAANALMSMMNPLLERIEKAESLLGGLASRTGEADAAAAREDLTESYPQLKRAESWKGVEAHAAKLQKEVAGLDTATAVKQAARVFYGDPIEPEDTNKSSREQGLGSMGDYSARIGSREMSAQDMADQAIWDLVEKDGYGS